MEAGKSEGLTLSTVVDVDAIVGIRRLRVTLLPSTAFWSAVFRNRVFGRGCKGGGGATSDLII